jgi:hypothetical protein
VLRGMGCSGFETQTLVWLSGRLDAPRLRASIARLSEAYPAVAARLVEGDNAAPYWRFRPGASCPLAEIELASAEPSAVLDCAGRLLSTPNDPTESDPLRFHLLRRAGEQDVVLLQYNHALMDNNAAVSLLREIDRLSAPGAGSAKAPDEGRHNLAWQYLRRFPRERRRRASKETLRLWGRSLKGGTVCLGRRSAGNGPVQARIATVCLAEDATRALQAHTTQAGGLPSLSLVVLASAFRAVGRLAPAVGAVGRRVLTGIGIDLGRRGRRELTFQNLVSLVPLSVRLEDLADRDGLLRALGVQMRAHLGGDADLGMLQLVALMGRPVRDHARWAVEHFLRHGFSLWYGYFGAPAEAGESFCGVPVERIFCTGPAWPGAGVTLLVNPHRGRLFFQATYTPSSVPEPLAQEFLNEVIGDLLPTR